MPKIISDISSYIQAVKEIVQDMDTDSHSVVVFRGETEPYDTPCQPTIFRTKLSQTDKFFEKNLFEEMTANHLTNGTNYLEIAIDAQHGGFPSRLLDVTYNCLVALYFAVTPFYTQPETAGDDKDGAVSVFFLENLYCPTGNNITEAYNACINHQQTWFSDHDLFQKNHKLIDHIKKNPRIIAQQGAFILFQGERLSGFPRYQYKTIKIDRNAKSQLRQDLRRYFGIHTGSIYPEELNLVDEMIRKSTQVSSQSFSLDGEMKLILHNIKQLTEYYLEELELAAGVKYQEIIEEAEEGLKDYHLRMKEFLASQEKEGMEKKEKACQWANDFNELILTFADEAESLMDREPNRKIKICRDDLQL